MTVNEYLSNPYGKGSAFANVTRQREDLDLQFSRLSERISCRTYMYRNAAIYHILVPSQKNDETYDVILEIPFKEKTEETISLVDREFRVFSNCPSFIFTYAHVFRAQGMLCPWLIEKYSPEVRKREPSRSNPYNVIGYERSLYLAMKYLKVSGKILSVSVRNSPIRPSSYAEIAKMVRTQEQIMSRSRSKLKQTDPPKNLPPSKTNNARKDSKSSSFLRTAKTGTSKKTSKSQKSAKTKKIK